MRNKSALPAALTTSALLLALCAAVTVGAPADGEKKDKDVIEVTIKDLRFDPETVTIKVGQTVRWLNKDDRDHSIMADDQSFKSGNLRPNEKFEHKFKEAGTFEYKCMLRMRMTGSVVVEEKKK